MDLNVIQEFKEYKKDPEMAVAVAAIKALTGVIKRDTATTMMELQNDLQAAAESLKTYHATSTTSGVSTISLTAGCELFLRYVTRCFLEFDDFDQCKLQLIERGEVFANTSLSSRNRISQLGHNFVREGMVVLTHGASRVVIKLLCQAAETKHFSVILTESRPYYSTKQPSAAQILAEAGIPTTIIPDSAIGYSMEKADMVIVGAEGVVENGGIVNKMGTFTCAMVAKAMNKPFYVAAESYKFARLYPLNQRDFPEKIGDPLIAECSCTPVIENPNIKRDCPTGDYTPPQYITLLFTDLGVLTPSAVSDELIKLYQ